MSLTLGPIGVRAGGWYRAAGHYCRRDYMAQACEVDRGNCYPRRRVR